MKPRPDESLPLPDFELPAAPAEPPVPGVLPPAPAAAPGGPLETLADDPANPPAETGMQDATEIAAAPPGLAPDEVSPELTNWKNDLRRDFEAWLATIAEIPGQDDTDDAAEDDPADAPDLYSFYAQFAAASAESRKANRRTAEAMSQWGETLARFESGLQPLRETAAQLAAAQPKAGRMSRAHSLVLVELLDRMHRLARAFATPPATQRSWFGAARDDAWRRAWSAQRQALDILVDHLENWLTKEGVTRISAAGETFDPAIMMAVAAESDPTRPPQTVIEEVAAGYLRDGELLRAAQVKVSR